MQKDEGTVTISVRNEQFQISARRTESQRTYRKLRSAARLCAREAKVKADKFRLMKYH
jgi:hypothetical protein